MRRFNFESAKRKHQDCKLDLVTCDCDALASKFGQLALQVQHVNSFADIVEKHTKFVTKLVNASGPQVSKLP